MISFHAGFVFGFHYIQKFRNRSTGIDFSARFYHLSKFL